VLMQPFVDDPPTVEEHDAITVIDHPRLLG
jgi:hypothetical protein